MTITAKIIADSISPAGVRLTTMQLLYPRFIHSEFMTHRVFSRNASSSRAIPVKKMIEMLIADPAMPVYWGSNKAGMQAGAELEGNDLYHVKALWLGCLSEAITIAASLVDRGLHKQIANRILEPWAHIGVVVTATNWDNFYNLRRHPDAQPEIHELADRMWEAHETGPMPTQLNPGDWHLPYVSENDKDMICFDMGKGSDRKPEFIDTAIKLSVARCARVSYLTHDGLTPDLKKDIELYDRLVGSIPIHASPAEHQATPDIKFMDNTTWHNPELHGNFTGWKQFRKILELTL